MSVLGEVLELLHHAQSRYRSVEAWGIQRRHLTLHLEAFERSIPQGAIRLTASRSSRAGREQPDQATDAWRYWAEVPDRWGAQFAVGDETVTVASVAGTWRSRSPSRGAHTNNGRPNMQHGKGPGEILFHPARLLPALELHVVGETTHLGRPAYRVEAQPIHPPDEEHNFALHDLASGADDYELTVDAERGFILRAEARLSNTPFHALELTRLAVDQTLAPEAFELEPPHGQTFEVFEPTLHASLAELPGLVPFDIYVPDPPPGLAPHAIVQKADNKAGTPLQVTLTYAVMDGHTHLGNIWIEQSAEAFVDATETPNWRTVGNYQISSEPQLGRVRTRVRLQRSDTYLHLESAVVDTDRLIHIATTLVPLPLDPPTVRPAP